MLEEALRYGDFNALESQFLRSSFVAVEQAEQEKEAAHRPELEQERQRTEELARLTRRIRWFLVALIIMVVIAITALAFAFISASG